MQDRYNQLEAENRQLESQGRPTKKPSQDWVTDFITGMFGHGAGDWSNVERKMRQGDASLPMMGQDLPDEAIAGGKGLSYAIGGGNTVSIPSVADASWQGRFAPNIFKTRRGDLAGGTTTYMTYDDYKKKYVDRLHQRLGGRW
jgi:hypothetical protein